VLAGGVAAPAMVRAADLLNVGIVPGESVASAYYADRLGFFTAAGLEVRLQILPSGPAVAAATTGGTIDIGAVNTGSHASARLRGVPLRAVAPGAVIGARSVGDELMVAKSSPIRTGADLNGKVVATNALATAQHAAAMAWIDQHGGDAKTVKFVEVAISATPAAIEAGRADAGIFVEPFTTLAQSTLRSLGPLYTGLRKPFLIFSLCAMEPWLQNNAAAAAKFSATIRRAGAWANAREHDRERRQLNVDLTKLDPAVIDKMALREMGTAVTPAMMEPVLALMVRYGFLERPVDPNLMVWHA
jgi:NitT/TauT family transport system substrate-binding protein